MKDYRLSEIRDICKTHECATYVLPKCPLIMDYGDCLITYLANNGAPQNWEIDEKPKPKYKKNHTVWFWRYYGYAKSVRSAMITDIHINKRSVSYSLLYERERYKEKQLYATEEEAKKALDEWIGRNL